MPPAPVRVGVRDIQLYQFCDTISGIILLGMLVLSPWLFGTTQPEVIIGMNLAGGLIWVLLAIKWSLREFKGYRPATWDPNPNQNRTRLIQALLLVTALLLGFMLVSAINARADWNYDTQSLIYRPALWWLPHSYDQGRSWQILANYSALAGFFWGLWDWLRGKTNEEKRAGRELTATHNLVNRTAFPTRLRWLLWVLCWNGGLLALEAIIQRQSGTTKLLWLVTPEVYQQASFQFGPFAYRANGAQYLNLLWPVCLGFWWTLHHSTGLQRWQNHLLLPLGVLMATGPFISSSKAGALIAAGMLLSAGLFLAAASVLFPERSGKPFQIQATTIALLSLCLGAIVLLVWNFGWVGLGERMMTLDSGFSGREQMYETARRMAADFQWYGCGPGTFVAVFPLYRGSPEEFWPAQLHNDWLETLITFGWIGTGLILLAFGLVVGRWWLAGGIPGGRRFVGLIWLAFAGVFAHARFDFPFQIYSILMLALTWCAVLFSLSRRHQG